MLDKPTWTMYGVVSEKRELKTKKDEVWAYSIKIMALGGMYSVSTKDRRAYEAIGEGETLLLTGTFEQYNGQVQLVLSHAEGPKHTTSKAS